MHLESKMVKESKDTDGNQENREEPVAAGETQASSESGKELKKKNTHIWIWVVSSLAGLVLLAYLGIAVYFYSHFFPNTSINGMECGYLKAADAVEVLEQLSLEYSLEVTNREDAVLGIINAEDIGLTIDVAKGVGTLLGNQNVFVWIAAVFQTHNLELAYEVSFDNTTIGPLIAGWEAFQANNMESPQNAYISDYLDTVKGYEIIPETSGSTVNLEKLEEMLIDAVYIGTTAINLEEADCYVRAGITTKDTALNEKLAAMNKLVGASITYDWNGNEVVLDGDTIHEWIITDTGELTLDEEAVAEFVKEMAKAYDTYGNKHNFRTTLGETLSLPNGGYGWKTDKTSETEELVKLINDGAVTEREPAYSSKGAQKGENDIGSSYVEIDLTNQHLYLYIKGSIVLESDLVSGRMNRSGSQTPAGVYGLTYKTTNAVLRGDDYETPVNYWMPFNGNIGMHDAIWRSNFGGQIYQTSGSHGCINLPLSAASEIYAYISTGFPVICYYY